MFCPMELKCGGCSKREDGECPMFDISSALKDIAKSLAIVEQASVDTVKQLREIDKSLRLID